MTGSEFVENDHREPLDRHDASVDEVAQRFVLEEQRQDDDDRRGTGQQRRNDVVLQKGAVGPFDICSIE